LAMAITLMIMGNRCDRLTANRHLLTIPAEISFQILSNN